MRFCSLRAPRARVAAALFGVVLAAGCAPVVYEVVPGGIPTGSKPRAGRNFFAGARLWVNPNNPAGRHAAAWRASRPGDAALLRYLGEQPEVAWIGDWSGDVRAEVDRTVTAMAAAGALPVLVAYNIPKRDCGRYSAGGARGVDGYGRWVRGFAAGLRGRRAVVILEPDAVAASDCLGARDRDARFAALRDAVAVLKQQGAAVYLDAGTATWHRPEQIAERLRRAGVMHADGFALNVSNFVATPLNVAFGEQVSRQVGGKHFVVDTGRNGAGVSRAGVWCNTRQMAVGPAPTTRTGHPLVDAYLWIKRPGDSDGPCNGGPRAGQWWPEYALELARRARARGVRVAAGE